MTTGPSTDADNYPPWIDISAGAAQLVGQGPAVLADDQNGRLLVATDNANLFRCGLDGTGCTTFSAGAANGAGHSRLLIDSSNSKRLLVEDGPLLFRCELDGTSCVKTDISAAAGQPTGAAMGATKK